MSGTSAGAKKGWAHRKRVSAGRLGGDRTAAQSKGARERKAAFEAGASKRIAAIKRKQR